MAWLRRLSLRSRLILIGTAGLAVGLLLGGLLLVAMLHYVLIRSVDDGAHGTATDVAALVQAGAPTDPVPTSGTQYVQVLDAQDRIRAASIGADHLVPLLSGLPDSTQRTCPRRMAGRRDSCRRLSCCLRHSLHLSSESEAPSCRLSRKRRQLV